VTTDDERVARTVRMLREHGQSRKHRHVIEGHNGRLDAIQAGFLRVKLKYLDGWNEQRRAAAATYDDLLSGSPEVVVPVQREGSRGVYHLYVIRHDDRDALAEHLEDHGVSTGLHYPTPVHLQPCYRGWGYAAGSLPVTEGAAAQVLSLPMYPGLTPAQQRSVVDVIGAFRGAEARG
jgi:dTDP-4-amino-4,6-dideoxygalactose transaminase